MSVNIIIVGRSNVGKSTLFNRLIGRRLALVHDIPGVTRDLREGYIKSFDRSYKLIDTAGFEDIKKRITKKTKAIIIVYFTGYFKRINGLKEFKSDLEREKSVEKMPADIDVEEEKIIEIGNYESGKGLIPPTWWFGKDYFELKTNEKLKEFIPKKDKRWVHFAKTNYPLTKIVVPSEVKGEMMSLSWNDKRFSNFNKNILINTINNFIRVFPPGTNIGSKKHTSSTGASRGINCLGQSGFIT